MNREIQTENNNRNFLREAAILSVAGFTVKIISVIFKIPLTNLLGESIGVFTAAYSIYAMLFMLSTSGLPVAVSKLVAWSNGKGRGREAKRIAFLSALVFGVLGLVLALSLVLFAPILSEFTNHNESALTMRVIAPALFFMCISSAVRGYFQGLNNMLPSAVSQFIEATFKMAIGLTGAFYANKMGYSVAVQSAFAISGVTVGSVLSTVYILLYFKFSKTNKVLDLDRETEKDSKIVKTLAAVAFPVTLTAASLYFSEFLDTVLVVKLLSQSGETLDNAKILFSAYTGLSVPIYDLFPSSLIFPLGAGILPAVSGAIALKKMSKAEDLSNQVLKISSVIAILCSVFLFVTGKSCISLIYGTEDWSDIITLSSGKNILPLDAASVSLSVLALIIFFISFVSVSNSLMNAYGIPKYALFTSVAGILILALSEILLLKSEIRAYAPPTALLICYFSVMVLDIILLKKKCALRLELKNIFLKPFLCGLITLGVTFAVYKTAVYCFGEAYLERFNSFIILSVTGIVMVITYITLNLLFRTLKSEDIKLLPKGEYLAEKLLKSGWID